MQTQAHVGPTSCGTPQARGRVRPHGHTCPVPARPPTERPPAVGATGTRDREGPSVTCPRGPHEGGAWAPGHATSRDFSMVAPRGAVPPACPPAAPHLELLLLGHCHRHVSHEERVALLSDLIPVILHAEPAHMVVLPWVCGGSKDSSDRPATRADGRSTLHPAAQDGPSPQEGLCTPLPQRHRPHRSDVPVPAGSPRTRHHRAPCNALRNAGARFSSVTFIFIFSPSN